MNLKCFQGKKSFPIILMSILFLGNAITLNSAIAEQISNSDIPTLVLGNIYTGCMSDWNSSVMTKQQAITYCSCLRDSMKANFNFSSFSKLDRDTRMNTTTPEEDSKMDTIVKACMNQAAPNSK